MADLSREQVADTISAVLIAHRTSLVAQPDSPGGAFGALVDAAMALVEAPQEGMSEDDVEYVCAALMEVGGWDEIDGDGTDASIIADHIRRLPHVLADRATEAPQPRVLTDGDVHLLWRGETSDPNGQYTEHGLSFIAGCPLLDVAAGTVWIVVDPDQSVTHRCPVGDSAVTPCCGRSPLELVVTDRMSQFDALVTCQAPVHGDTEPPSAHECPHSLCSSTDQPDGSTLLTCRFCGHEQVEQFKAWVPLADLRSTEAPDGR